MERAASLISLRNHHKFNRQRADDNIPTVSSAPYMGNIATNSSDDASVAYSSRTRKSLHIGRRTLLLTQTFSLLIFTFVISLGCLQHKEKLSRLRSHDITKLQQKTANLLDKCLFSSNHENTDLLEYDTKASVEDENVVWNAAVGERNRLSSPNFCYHTVKNISSLQFAKNDVCNLSQSYCDTKHIYRERGSNNLYNNLPHTDTASNDLNANYSDYSHRFPKAISMYVQKGRQPEHFLDSNSSVIVCTNEPIGKFWFFFWKNIRDFTYKFFVYMSSEFLNLLRKIANFFHAKVNVLIEKSLKKIFPADKQNFFNSFLHTSNIKEGSGVDVENFELSNEGLCGNISVIKDDNICDTLNFIKNQEHTSSQRDIPVSSDASYENFFIVFLLLKEEVASKDNFILPYIYILPQGLLLTLQYINRVNYTDFSTPKNYSSLKFSWSFVDVSHFCHTLKPTSAVKVCNASIFNYFNLIPNKFSFGDPINKSGMQKYLDIHSRIIDAATDGFLKKLFLMEDEELLQMARAKHEKVKNSADSMCSFLNNTNRNTSSIFLDSFETFDNFSIKGAVNDREKLLERIEATQVLEAFISIYLALNLNFFPGGVNSPCFPFRIILNKSLGLYFGLFPYLFVFFGWIHSIFSLHPLTLVHFPRMIFYFAIALFRFFFLYLGGNLAEYAFCSKQSRDCDFSDHIVLYMMFLLIASIEASSVPLTHFKHSYWIFFVRLYYIFLFVVICYMAYFTSLHFHNPAEVWYGFAVGFLGLYCPFWILTDVLKLPSLNRIGILRVLPERKFSYTQLNKEKKLFFSGGVCSVVEDGTAGGSVNFPVKRRSRSQVFFYRRSKEVQ